MSALIDIKIVCENPEDNWVTTVNSKVTLEELTNYFLNSSEGFYNEDTRIKPIKIIILK